MLTPSDIEKYKQLLLERLRDSDEQIEGLAERCEPVSPDPAIGRLTRQDAMQDQQMALHQRRRLVLQQTQIKAALDRISRGTFGICAQCKTTIARERLDLAPMGPLCLQCLKKLSGGRP